MVLAILAATWSQLLDGFLLRYYVSMLVIIVISCTGSRKSQGNKVTAIQPLTPADDKMRGGSWTRRLWEEAQEELRAF